MAEKSQTAQYVSLYRECASVPSVKWAAIIKSTPGDVCIHSKWSAYNVGQHEKTSFTKRYLSIGKPDFSFLPVGFPGESSNEKLLSVSPSHGLFSVLRKITDKKGEKQQLLEVWKQNCLWKSLDLTSLDIHGEVNDDNQFGSFQWSPDETKLAYIAEKKNPKNMSFFSQKLNQDSETQEMGIGQYREEWGEQLVGKHHPVVCVANLQTSEVAEIDLEDKSCGQVIWGPGGENLICVGWNEQPRRLGIIFCTNRKSALYLIDVKNENKVSVLHEREGWSSLSPILSPDKRTLVFLEVPDKGPHRSCARLCKMDMTTRATSIVVDVVEKAYDTEFPGLYCDTLHPNCFASDGGNIFLTSYWQSKKEIIAVNINTGVVRRVTNDSTLGSWELLDLVDNMALAACSAPDLRPHMVMADLSDFVYKSHSPVWTSVEKTSPKVSNVSWKILDFQPTDCSDKAYRFQCVLITPNLDKGQKYPLIVIPHGGPHSVIEAGYSLSPTFFVKLNFAVLLVNYRGSLGFGNSVLRSLLGAVGTADVKDVQQSVEYMLKEEWVDSNQIVLSGGSHGGFLSAHLIGQYPDTYKVCIVRNPVVDISGKLEGTDIPDWGFAESGQEDKFNFSWLPTPDVRKIMWQHSPYQYINQVKTPLLLLIGQNDLRVPPTQGINYYHTLKAMGKQCQMFVYNDNHSLSSTDVESDTFVRIALWISQYLAK